MELSQILKQFPNFHQWVKDKKVSSKSLSILTELKTKSSLEILLKWIEKHKASHSQGLQILELGAELMLMDKNVQSLFLEEAEASSLIERLKKLRFPQSSAYDKQQSEIVSGLNWTKSIKARWVRQKDKGALSIQFDSFSLKDFEQKIQKLNSIYKQLAKEKKLWKS